MTKKIRRRIIRWLLLSPVLLVLVFVLVNARMSFRSSDEKTMQYFRKRGIEARIGRIPFGGGEMRYVETGASADSLPVVLFVHGAPGSGNNFYAYLADSLLRRRARLITIDRPGYGYSNYGQSEPSFAAQAAAVGAVLNRYPAQKAVLVGHSYGGPVIAQAALDDPAPITALLLLAPVIDPDSEPAPWYAGFSRWRATRPMLSKAWQVSGDEKFAHVEELRRLQPRWRELTVPIVHIHGASDFLAPPEENMAFSRRHIPEAQLKIVELPNTNHFIPWTDYERVREELVKLLEK
jgi:pimeloyl-ACP methyl ester carboxylesterase